MNIYQMLECSFEPLHVFMHISTYICKLVTVTVFVCNSELRSSYVIRSWIVNGCDWHIINQCCKNLMHKKFNNDKFYTAS